MLLKNHSALLFKSFITGELSTSQKQAIIKLIEKKDRDKRFIKTGDLSHF